MLIIIIKKITVNRSIRRSASRVGSSQGTSVDLKHRSRELQGSGNSTDFSSTINVFPAYLLTFSTLGLVSLYLFVLCSLEVLTNICVESTA
jgi:hypothetical protein